MSIAAVWFDLANDNRSDPHKLIESAMELYHIPEKVQDIVKSCFGEIQIRSTVDEFTPNSDKEFRKGWVTECTISNTLFVMGMGIMARTPERETREPMMDSGIYQHQSEASRITSQ